MTNLFKNKKQKVVWLICAVLIFIDLLKLSDTSSNICVGLDCSTDPISYFFLHIFGYVIISFILTGIVQDERN